MKTLIILSGLLLVLWLYAGMPIVKKPTSLDFRDDSSRYCLQSPVNATTTLEYVGGDLVFIDLEGNIYKPLPCLK